MVKDPKWLRTGHEISNFTLLPREAWANWLLCAVLSKVGDQEVTFAEDDEGDGILVEKSTGMGIPVEHVSRLDVPSKKPLAGGAQGVIDAIDLKISRGPEYAAGKYLVVFFEGLGQFFRSEIRKNIRNRHNFRMVFSIGLQSIQEDGYRYLVTQFHDFHSVTFLFYITYDFTDWQVGVVS